MAPTEVLIVDYGFGNVRSVVNALEFVGLAPKLSSDPKDVATARNLLLPGVGAFGSAMQELGRRQLSEAIHIAVYRGARLLGICLGMQLLFENSNEFGLHRGLGLLPGCVRPLVPEEEVSPTKRATHIGWQRVVPGNQGVLSNMFQGSLSEYYFVHSFAAQPKNDGALIVAGWAQHHQEPFVAAVEKENVLGVQFHPERSGAAGLSLLAGAFVSDAGR